MKMKRPRSSTARRPARGDVTAARQFFARFVTATVGVHNQRIVNAFATVAREDFVGPGPWHIFVGDGYIVTESDDPVVLYQNILVGLAPERSINNGQPTLHAKGLAMAEPQPNDRVVQVGAGTGYYTAIFAQLVGPGGTVNAYEIEQDLAARATVNLAPYPNVQVRAQSALAAQLPSADIIYVCAGATHVPAEFLDALAIGGRLVLPLTPNERLGCMLLVTRKSATDFAAHIFSTAAFIPCSGARDDAQSKALAAALDAGGTDRVRTLRRDHPDASAWCVGAGWWLSTQQ
jgi:protein-L-isoaspartate(D-aspartate) O-methyltransferase